MPKETLISQEEIVNKEEIQNLVKKIIIKLLIYYNVSDKDIFKNIREDLSNKLGENFLNICLNLIDTISSIKIILNNNSSSNSNENINNNSNKNSKEEIDNIEKENSQLKKKSELLKQFNSLTKEFITTSPNESLTILSLFKAKEIDLPLYYRIGYEIDKKFQNLLTNKEASGINLNLTFTNCLECLTNNKPIFLISMAAVVNDISLIRAYFEDNPDAVTECNNTEFNPLFFAVREGHIQIYEFLLSQKDIDITKTDEHKRTLLHLAVISGQPEVVKMVLEKLTETPDVEISPDGEGYTPLLTAIQSKREDICEILLQNNKVISQIDFSNKQNKTAILLAAEFGLLQTFEKLINLKANMLLRDKNNNTLLHLAAKGGSPEICSILLQKTHYEINAPNSEGQTALHLAIKAGKLSAAQTLIDLKKEDINILLQDHSGNTIVHLVLMAKHYEICNFLFDLLSENESASFFSNIPNNKEKTPLLLTIESGNIELFTKIFNIQKKEGNIFSADNEGNTLLHLAAMAKSPEICTFLLENHHSAVDLNSPNKHGKTPLALSAESKNLQVFTILFNKFQENESNIFWRNKNGDTLLHFALMAGYSEIFRLLNSDATTNVNPPNNQGTTPLHLLAATSDTLPLFTTLFNLIQEKGGDMFPTDNEHNTPLHIAYTCNNHAICLFLLDTPNLGKINRINKNNLTHLHIAAQFGNKIACEALVKNGADIFQKDLSNKTPFNIAIDYGQLEICKLFLNLIPNYSISKIELHDYKSQLLSKSNGPTREDFEIFKFFIENNVINLQDTKFDYSIKIINNLHSFLCLPSNEILFKMLEFLLNFYPSLIKEITHDPEHTFWKQYILKGCRSGGLEKIANKKFDLSFKDQSQKNLLHIITTTVTNDFLAEYQIDDNIPAESYGLVMACYQASLKGKSHAALDVCKFLINSNPELLEEYDSEGYTPLHYAAKNNIERLFAFLINNKIPFNVNKRTVKEQYSFLHLLTLNDCNSQDKIFIKNYSEAKIKLIKKVIDYGANLDTKDTAGLMPIDYVKDNEKLAGMLDIVEPKLFCAQP